MSEELKAPERIWLIPDGEHGFMWCDDPAPGIGMEPEDATEYVMADRLTASQARAEAAEARVGELIEKGAQLDLALGDFLDAYVLTKQPIGAKAVKMAMYALRDALSAKPNLKGTPDGR